MSPTRMLQELHEELAILKESDTPLSDEYKAREASLLDSIKALEDWIETQK